MTWSDGHDYRWLWAVEEALPYEDLSQFAKQRPAQEPSDPEVLVAKGCRCPNCGAMAGIELEREPRAQEWEMHCISCSYRGKNGQSPTPVE